jgi:hypothetical protein
MKEIPAMLLGIEQKKGDPDRLDGRLTVYANIDIDPSDLMSMKHPIASMVHNGLLVAQGNYKEQNNLKSALDPEKLKEKMENIDDLEDFIPTPAKIVSFPSVEDILSQEGDVYYAGFFKNVGNAILSVNSLPILYQSQFREQEIQKVRNEIELLITQIEKNEPSRKPFYSSNLQAEEKIMKEFIPNMLYCRKEKKVFDAAEKQFREFLHGYRSREDIDSIVSIIADEHELTSKHFKLLELFAKKIARVMEEHFVEAEKLQKEIAELQRQ